MGETISSVRSLPVSEIRDWIEYFEARDLERQKEVTTFFGQYFDTVVNIINKLTGK